ncbi:ABC transporter permease [Spiroplasma taiwanense]|uniref:Permease family protein n=1 Tax=Spiroplasma taiwanense CT-1 TaxID=1276220 RepID=S5MB68_9MOLU|nr:ABC transporter permease [Spiroplasma taiwanense]AGR41018.1 permease family protein [Spiroplasma taiwanense CT-1]
MKKATFFLYLKQGIKGVLKFRIQFYVIIILTFLSTLILTISISTSERLNQNYNQTMNKYEKFDYINQKAVGIPSDGKEAVTVTPLIDFINDEFLAVYDSTDLNNPANNKGIEYNFNLSYFNNQYTDYGYKETFLTKAFEDQEVESKLFDMLKNENYYNNIASFIFDSARVYRDHQFIGTPFGDFQKLLIEKSKNYFLDDLFLSDGTSKEYLFTTPFYKLKQKNLISREDFTLEIENYNDRNQYNRYFYFAIDNLAGQLNEMISNYINYFINQSKKEFELQTEITDMEQFFNENWYSKAGFKWIKNGYTDQNKIELATTLFIFLLGRAPINASTLNEKQSAMIVTYSENAQQEINTPWRNRRDMSAEVKNNEILNSKFQLYQFGARGSITQLYGKIATEGDNINKLIDIPKRTINPLFLKHENSTNFIADIGSGSNFSDLTAWKEFDFGSFNRAKAYFLRNEILSQAVDLKYEARAEVVLQDNVSEINYRIINLDNTWKDRITIYDGFMPRNKNEIIINSQFARKNNLKLGSNITIGGGNFTISAFGVDPLSYYPITDLLTPIPNNEKSAIVFADNSVISDQMITFDFSKYATNYAYNILKSSDSQNAQKGVAAFVAHSFSSIKNLLYNYNFLYNKNEIDQNFYDSSKYNENYTSFNNSPLSYNWTLTPKITEVFNIISILFSSLICLITLIAVVVAVKKTIHLNSGEIGILKSMGAKSSEIASSYLSYGVIVMFIVIPIAWIIGSFLQEPVASFFLQFVSGQYNLAIFKYLPFVLGFLIFGVFLAIVSYFTAFLLIRKPTLEILKRKDSQKTILWIRKLKLALTNKSRFSIRFSSELAISSFSKTLLTAATIFFAGFFVSGSLAIPGIVDNFVNSYNRNINYSNNSRNIELIGNAPLAKTSLSPTQEVDEYEENLFNTNNIFGSEIEQISKSVSQIGPSPDSSVIPQILISPENNNQFSTSWTYDKLSSTSSQYDFLVREEAIDEETELNSLISIIASILGNNLSQLVGSGISIADIQKMIEWTVHSNSSELENNFSVRLKKILETSDLLTNGLPQLLVNFINNSSTTEGNWKEQIINIIISQTPSYIKNYVTKSENRLNNFEFGWQVNKYIPGVDNLYTSINIKSQNDKNLPIIGLNSSQSAYNIEKVNSDKIFKSEYQAQLINKVLYGNTLANEDYELISDIYDKETKQLSVPVISNEQTDFNINNNWDLLKDININSKRMVITSTQENIPNDAWMYDDRDWNHYKASNILNENQFLTMSSLQGSKFTYAPIFDYKNGSTEVNDFSKYKYADLKNNSYAFYNLTSTFNKDGSEDLNLEIRPYYQYENIVLFLPKKFQLDFEKIKNLGNSDSSAWWIENLDFIPEKTLNAWKNTDSSLKDENDFFAIRPYSLFFDQRGEYKRENENLSGEALKNIKEAYNNFFARSIREANGPISLSNIDLNWTGISNGNVSKINFKKVGNIEVYGKSLIIADQNLVNLINGFSIDKYTPFNLQYEDFNSQNNSSYTQDGVTINTYEKLNPNTIVNNDKSQWVYGEDEVQKSVRPNMWYTGIYSNAEEPYFITIQASFARNPKIGEDTLNGNTPYKSSIEIESTTFLSQEEALINQISAIVLSIGILFISLLIVIMILTVTLINDLFVNQYKRFMIVMKSLGYSNFEIIYYTFGFVTGFSILTYISGVSLSYVAIYAIVKIINSIIGIIPFGMTWWAPFVATILVFGMYIISITITTRRIRTESPSTLMA